MLELSQDVVAAKLVVKSCVEDSDDDVVNSEVAPNEDEPSVWHDSPPYLGHRVSTVFQIALEQIQGAKMANWVLWT